MTAGYSEFEFDLPGALLNRLVDEFKNLSDAPLNASVLKAIPNEQGVYQLFIQKDAALDLVYIGKTDAEAGLRSRLLRHAGKIEHRQNLDPAKVRFKAIRVYVFTAIDLETQLIAHYGGVQKVQWNGSGFGSNDPGRERDTTKYKPDHFDTQYPIDTTRPLAFSVPPNGSAADVLKTLKEKLPYIIRFEAKAPKSRQPHADLENTKVTIGSAQPWTPESVIAQVIRQLPTGWHATKLPNCIIIYKNDTRKFPSGRTIANSP
jgi:hypothetical protein